MPLTRHNPGLKVLGDTGRRTHARPTVSCSLRCEATDDRSSGGVCSPCPGGHFKLPHPWPGQNPPLDSGGTRRSSGTSGALGKALGGFFQAPALAFELEQMPVVHDAVEKRRDHDDVSQELPPVIYAPVRCDDDGGFLVAAHEHVGELIAGVYWKLAQEQIVDDEQLRGGDLSAVLA